MEHEKLRIVIVDSGVDISHPQFKNSNVEGYTYKDSKLHEGCPDEYGHGTAIYQIIRSVSDIADIINIKLPDIEHSNTRMELADILEYIADHIPCNILNLSLGINMCTNLKEIKRVCDKLNDKEVVIIAAHDNSGSIAYPAGLENVIGVITGSMCKRTDEFEYVEDTVVNIAAKGNVQRVAWVKPEYLAVGGNSFACAHVTVQAAKFMYLGAKKRKELLLKFKEIAVKQYSTKVTVKQKGLPFKIKKAAIFPFNKEMHSLVRYMDMLPFQIVDVYDIKYSAAVGATTSHLLKDTSVGEFVIKNIDCIDWNTFDTLILGHTSEVSLLIHKENFCKEIIRQAIAKGKQIYCFDDIGRTGYQRNDSIYFPEINAGDMPPQRFGMMYRITKPVLGIFGTSSRQGKFTLQLRLRKDFMEMGYHVGQIGTEPSALLYDMDYVFPMGYNSSVYIGGYQTVRYLNYIINDLCVRDKDIILVGSQSGTVPYDTGNMNQFTISQIDFLMGSQPDAVILCVNPYDEISYIKRTIRCIESCVECCVLALVIFPMTIQDGWKGSYGARRPLSEEECMKMKEKLFDEMGLPVYRLGEEVDMRELVKHIIGFFSN